jgi:ribosome-binding factor A
VVYGNAGVLENACRDDEELHAILDDSIGNPELMKQRVSAAIASKGVSAATVFCSFAFPVCFAV